MKSKKFTVLFICVALLLWGAWYLSEQYAREYGPTSKLQQKESFVKLISEVWTFAKVNGDEICKKNENTDDFFYQCNPHYFSCLIKNNLLSSMYEKLNLSVSLSPDYIYKNQSGYKEYKYTANINGNIHAISLKDSCHEVYLPQRFYPFLVEQRLHTYEWDNHSRNIFVDKYLVRAFEVLEYAKEIKDLELISKFKNVSQSSVAVNLSVEQMKSYCRFHGKEIMSAEVFDAASIFPEDESDNKSRLLRAPYYPWHRKNTDSILFDVQEKNKKIEEKEIQKLCRKNFSKDCLKFSFINYDRENVSWMGMYEVFGGYLEFLVNTLYPLENLKLSSKYFPAKSKVHRTGVRGYWDMEGFGLNNLLIKGEESLEEYEIAFRCMRVM